MRQPGAARRGPQTAELDPHQLFTTFDTRPPNTVTTSTDQGELLGLNLTDVFNTLQIDLGWLYVNDSIFRTDLSG